MPMYRVTHTGGSKPWVISANSEEHARSIARARLRVGLKHGFRDVSPATKAQLMRDADAASKRATVTELDPNRRRHDETRRKP
jgi:anaerobic glycerol-3-phosphate dehydrogenase